ncbi:MAG TPA: S8 family serine peptidase [Methanothrix sp.]|nr:S8 family serine peptidase [Methanothrix sp.]HOK57970.1 S8 family serine peptidase [Methanothrix sp.]HOL43373.1 S8 family serine peptidase [Methanothrix sp.]HPO88376.1 S8 family serine peptidase [Methanothrix sp.]
MDPGRCVLLIAVLILMPTACAISVSYASSGYGGSVTLSESYELDTSTALSESTGLGQGSVEQTKSASGTGTNRISTSISSKEYTAGSSIESTSSLSLSSAFAGDGSGAGISQALSASGSVSSSLKGVSGGLEAVHSAGVESGLLSSAQSIGVGKDVSAMESTRIAGINGYVSAGFSSKEGAGEVASAVSQGAICANLGSGSSAVYGDLALSGPGSLTASASDSESSSKHEVIIEDEGGDADESASTMLLAATGGYALSGTSLSATGDQVSLSSVISNPKGSLITKEAQSGVSKPMSSQSIGIASGSSVTTTWSRSGRGRMSSISSTYKSTDGTKSVSNSVSGSGYPYSIAGSATYSQSSAAMYQTLSSTNGALTTSQSAWSLSNGEELRAASTLSSSGTISGTQIAISDPVKVISSQSLTVTGKATVSSSSRASSNGDSSSTSASVSGASKMSLTALADASNTRYNNELYHRTGAFFDSSGYAASIKADSSASYLNNFARSHGEWTKAGSGELTVSAETVKSAVSDVEIKTGSDAALSYTQSGTGSTVKSGLYTYAAKRSGGDVYLYQSHLYSHAYPKNDHHSMDEYVSTASSAISAKKSDMKIQQWENGKWVAAKNYYSSGSYTAAVRANDILTSAYKWDRLWEVQPRSKTPYDRVPWGVEYMYSSSLLSKTYGGEGIDVAIIDTGADTLHPDLLMRIEDFADAYGPGEYTQSDSKGHGTHVAGTIVADGGFDGKGIYGMAPEADLRVYSTNFYYSDVASGIYRATDLGAEIISMSLGGSVESSTLNRALDYAMANGVLLVAAAGNGLPDNPTMATPARYPGVVGVGAIDRSGNAIWWSSPGSNDGDYIPEGNEVTFGAPGVSVYSTYPTYWGYYTTMSGTSMATPHIAGTAASLWSRYLIYGDGANDIRSLMINCAKQNDVTTVKVTPESVLYRSYAEPYSNSGYYGIIYPYMSGSTYYLNILQGDDVLTGVGVPRISL